MNNLAVNITNGTGITKDVTEANRWYRKAAEAGNADAMHNLGRAYHEGFGISRDQREAARLIIAALKKVMRSRLNR